MTESFGLLSFWQEVYAVANKTMLHVDTSEVQHVLNELRKVYSEKEVKTVLRRALVRTVPAVRKTLMEELPKEYVLTGKKNWIRRAIGNARISEGGFLGLSVTATIPVDGVRGPIGTGKKGTFHTFRYRKSRKRKNNAKRISVRVVTDGTTVLPAKMQRQGGNAPFVASGGKGSGMVLTRRTKKRFPLVRVVAVGVPQMPTNRASDKVQSRVLDVLYKRIEHEHDYMLSKIGPR